MIENTGLSQVENMKSLFLIWSSSFVLLFNSENPGVLLHQGSDEDNKLGLDQTLSLCSYDPSVGDTEKGHFVRFDSLKLQKSAFGEI